jgi:thioredoxin-like negative regulator of GroEL
MLRTNREWVRLFPSTSSSAALDTKFSQAQHAYLRGHWQEAEALVSEILTERATDVETRLLLASIQRRSGSLAAARKTFDELLNEPGAAKWQMEIRADLKQMDEAGKDDSSLDRAAKAA